ncbi:UNVERIFIED_CONTAM: uncharacterized protein Cloal_4036 [Acetivibrio alkalicellulosi]
MKIDISSILKIDDALLNIELKEDMKFLDGISEDVEFEQPVSVKGNIVNMGSVLKLTGELEVSYNTKCSRCLNDVNTKLNVQLREDFFEEGQNAEGAYTYAGRYVELEKVIKDNIILNLPARQVCRDNCKGLCPGCGIDLNEKTCECKFKESDPRLEALKNFFDN